MIRRAWSWLLMAPGLAVPIAGWRGSVAWAIFHESPNWQSAIRDEAARATEGAGVRNAVIFIRTPDHPHGDRWWESVFLRNGLFSDTTDVIFARDLGERNGKLMNLYPGREFYLFDRPALEPLGPP